MKKKLLTTLCLALCTVSLMAQATSYAGGDGTRENPFLISNADELAKLAKDVNTEANFSRGRYFKLTQDIVINAAVNEVALATLQGGKAFPLTTMIGVYNGETDYLAFQGVFDGDGHTISGFYSVPNANYVGLFRVLDGAEVRNLGLKDCFVYAGAYLSCLAGLAKDSRIINCHVTDCKVYGWGSNSGPICGQALGTTKIQNCYTIAHMQTKNDTGGIVGRIGRGGTDEVVVENCYAHTTITLSKSNKGGVTATNSVGSIVRNCYFTAKAGANAVWPAQDKGTTEGCQQMTVDEMQEAAFLSLLNAHAEAIAGACRWQQGTTTPLHDYTHFTADDANVRDVSALATDPIPATGDTHADMDGDAPLLRWTAARDGKTVRQYIYFGTDSMEVAQATTAGALATIATETEYALTASLTPLATYFWRVDRETADGTVTRGDVWSFQPRHLAFPGAEGYGRFARGGRGGKVVYVTHLADSGEGSLRWALTNGSGPRTVLFKVSGIIDMGFKQCITDDNVTIAAQSAPGKGICIKHSDIGVKNDCIVRFLRARRGLGTSEETGNAIGTVYSDHTILDHVTASWGTDETFSSRGSRNITFQRSMISEALGIAGHRNYDPGTNHGYAATIGGDIGSFHHNLLADCEGRNWSMGGGTNANGEYAGRLDIFNNVVYNWHKRTTDGGAHEVNFVGNYYKCGEALSTTTLFTLQIEGNLKGTQSAYISGNVRDNKNGTITEDALNNTYRLQISDGRGSLDWQWLANEPFFPSYAKIESARDAYKSVLSDVGANQPMVDSHDARMVRETLNRTYTYVGSKSGIKGEIDDEMDAGGFDVYPEESWADDYDTDMDGLPDWWEALRGFDPNSAANDFRDSNADPDGDGYTELEHFLDFLAQPHLTLACGETSVVDVSALFMGYTDQPRYAVECVDPAIGCHLDGTMLSVSAATVETLANITLTVTDAAGSTYSRRLCVAVSEAFATGMDAIVERQEAEPSCIYDLFGRRATSFDAGRVYLYNGKVKVCRGER